MAIHQENCDVCNQLERCASGNHPRYLATLRVTTVVLGPHQKWPGYVVLLLQKPHTELTQLSRSEQISLMEDIAEVAAAVECLTGAHKLNIESLGNICHHLHWHIFPRQTAEPQPLDPVWVQMPAPGECEYDPLLHRSIQEGLRARLSP